MTVIPFQRRQPKGRPTGGEYAATEHGEAAFTLEGPRHRATRDIPATLLMAHIPAPTLLNDLSARVQDGYRAGREQDFAAQDRARDAFAALVPNLSRDDAGWRFDEALNLAEYGVDIEGNLEVTVAADTECHPGGPLNGYTPPDSQVGPGYGQGTKTVGSRYKPGRPVTETAREIRAELKAAARAGYLPQGLTYSVTTDRYSGGCALRVEARGVPDTDRIHPTETDKWGRPAERAEAKELRRRLEGIVRAYNFTDTDSMSDYSNVAFHERVDLEDDWNRQYREREAAEAAAKREAARAAR